MKIVKHMLQLLGICRMDSIIPWMLKLPQKWDLIKFMIIIMLHQIEDPMIVG